MRDKVPGIPVGDYLNCFNRGGESHPLGALSLAGSLHSLDTERNQAAACLHPFVCFLNVDVM